MSAQSQLSTQSFQKQIGLFGDSRAEPEGLRQKQALVGGPVRQRVDSAPPLIQRLIGVSDRGLLKMSLASED